MPSFWFALVLISVFSIDLGWLPASGAKTWQHFILPTIVLGYYAMPAIMRLTRAGMLEVLSSDYIRTARAKGSSEWRVLFTHALRNAIIPVVSLSAVQMGFMLGGSIVVESVFALPGAGLLAWESITRNDLPTVQALILLFSMFYIVFTLLADIMNAWLDPRMRPHDHFSSIPTAEQILEPSPSAILRRRIFGHSGFMIGTIIVAVIALVAIFAPMLLKYDPYTQDLLNRMVPPEFLGGKSDHVLGTDQLGRDYLARLLHGARVSLFIGLSAALISGIIGTAMGVAAGYFGGRVDAVVTFLINVRLAMPVVLVALAVVALFGGSLTVICHRSRPVTVGSLCGRHARFNITDRATEYVAASYAIGTSTPRILISEILPNLMNNLIVVATLEMAHAICWKPLCPS